VVRYVWSYVLRVAEPLNMCSEKRVLLEHFLRVPLEHSFDVLHAFKGVRVIGGHRHGS
jgi:hypothetical protein